MFCTPEGLSEPLITVDRKTEDSTEGKTSHTASEHANEVDGDDDFKDSNDNPDGNSGVGGDDDEEMQTARKNSPYCGRKTNRTVFMYRFSNNT